MITLTLENVCNIKFITSLVHFICYYYFIFKMKIKILVKKMRKIMLKKTTVFLWLEIFINIFK